MAKETMISELLATTATPVAFEELWTVNYRTGPIIKSQVIKASGKKEALAAGQRFVELQKMKFENKKILIIGEPQPFAIDVEEEITKFMRDEDSLRG